MKNILRDIRSKESISQADMGKALDVSRQTINSIENGKYDPSLPLAFKIAKYFNLKIEDIFFPS
ncbi:helix-turn-helix transcriptional regulator [Gammaproteobacteria bacterium]|nr:helix-turn-helix transcriptional regulator [Gammaproteobacteria bacterium]